MKNIILFPSSHHLTSHFNHLSQKSIFLSYFLLNWLGKEEEINMILQAKHLTKRYGDYMAVDDIQLEFEKADKRSDSICAKYENRSCFSS